MAANTGSQLERFDALARSNRELIEKGKRTNVEAHVVLDAMQAFKDGILSGVTLSASKQDLLEVCSKRVEDCALNPKQLRFLMECGVRYAGEACYLVCEPSAVRHEAMLTSIMQSLGIPRSFDPLKKGWQPPYWLDDSFKGALDETCISYFGTYMEVSVDDMRGRGEPFAPKKTWARRCHSRGVHFMGMYLTDMREHRGFYPNRMKEIEEALHAQGHVYYLWAAALLPPTWKPTVDVPTDWVAEAAIVDREISTYETPKAWVVEIVGKWQSGLFGACVRYPGEVVESRMTCTHLIGRRYGYDTASGKVRVLNSNTMLDIDGPWYRINGSEERVARAFSTRKKADAFVVENQLKNTVINHNHF